MEQEFPTTAPVTATVRVGAGAITVIAEDRTSAAVTIEPGDGSEGSRSAAENTSVSFTGDRLDIEAPNNVSSGLFRRGGRVRVTLRLPLDSRVRNQVGSADVRVEGRLAAEVNSGSGDTFASHTTALTVQTGSGDIRAESIGDLKVTTGSGDVTVTTASGEVVIKTASGDVRLDETHGPIRTSTASGDVQIGVARGEQVQVSTASGDVRLGVPVGTRAWLDLNTVSGSTTSELAMTDAPAQQDGPVLNIQIRTVSGDIALRRAGAATRTAM